MFLRKLDYLRRAMRFPYKSRAFIESYQGKKLKQVFAHAAGNVPLYKEKYRGLDKARILEELDSLRLESIPLVTREELAKLYPGGKLPPELAARGILRFTSGSSGKPLQAYYEEKAWDFAEAVYLRSVLVAGVKPYQRGAYFWSQPFPALSWYHSCGILRKHFIDVELHPAEQLRILNRLKPDYLHTFPSCLRLLLSEAGQSKESIKLRPKTIICTGELLNEDSREWFEEAFGCRVYNHYGTMEMNRMAWECEHRKMHIDEDAVFLESLDVNKQPVGLLATSLFQFVMPFIRYRLDDIVSFSEEPCKCGRKLKTMNIFEGRRDSFIVLPRGSLLSPRAICGSFDHEFLENNVVSNYRILQQKNRRVRIKVVRGKNFTSDTPEQVREFFIRLCKGDAPPVSVQTPPSLPKTRSGKSRVVLSKA